MPQLPRSFLHRSVLGSGLTDHELERMVEVLTRAERNHREWLLRLNRSLICRGDFGEDVMADDAHRRCRFGRWYYTEASGVVRDHEVFAALERLHARMHEQARTLALASGRPAGVALGDYDRFAEYQAVFFETLHRLRAAVAAAELKVEGRTECWMLT